MSDELKTTVEQRTLVFQTQVKRWINVECPACQGKGCEACYQTGKVSVLGYKTYLEVIGGGQRRMSETLKTAQEQRIESRHYVKESQHYKSIMPMTYEMALDLLDDADTAARLQEALESIMEIMDADNPESYRSDDREGAMDTAYSVAKRALEGKEAIK